MTLAPTLSDGLPTARPNPFDPPTPLAALRRSRPISPMTYFPDGQEGWLVTSHELVRRVMADNRFSNGVEFTASPIRQTGTTEMLNQLLTPGTFLRMDPPEHTRLRKMLTGSFTVKRMKSLEADIETIVESRLDEIAAAGPPADLAPDFALPVPSTVICALMGVPVEDRDRFEADAQQLPRIDIDAQDQLAAHLRIRDYIRELAERKRRDPGEDLISDLAVRDDLTDDELVGVGLLLLVAGHETTMNMLSLGTFALLEHSDQLHTLRDDPGLIRNAVEELLRYLSILHIGPFRVALEDVDVGDVTVRKGQMVTVSLPAANRDDRRFGGDPEQLDITREAGSHLAFGHGVHQCLGQQLARIEMRIEFTELLRRFPDLRLAVPADRIPLRTDMTLYGVHKLPVTW